jgi:PAS domain S-box-containing protein
VTNNTRHKDLAFSAMTLDILSNVLSRADSPGVLVEYLTEEIRELTGARCVVFIQCQSPSVGPTHRVVGVSPLRRREWAESSAVSRLVEIVQSLPATRLLNAEVSAEAAGLLHQEGFDLSISVPLTVGAFRVGAMLVLGLPEGPHIGSGIKLMNTLSTIVALVLRNAFLYESQEQIIHERTSRLQATNKALWASERRFRELLENVHLIAVTLDTQGMVTFCNDFLLTLTGWRRQEVVGANWFDLFVPEEIRESVRAVFSVAITTGGTPAHFENLIITRGGSYRTIVWDNTVLHNDDGAVSGVASLGTDVTDQRSLEAQLRQSQKMEAVGHLAGGIAHDFNNILTIIGGYGSMLQRTIAPGDSQREKVDQILAATERAANLTSSLLAFSRKQVLNPRAINLNEIVQKVGNFLLRIIGEDIHLKMSFKAEPLTVRVDSGQIEQVLMNLASNARDAMPKGGSLTIETDFQRMDDSFIKAHGYGAPGPYALVSVIDTGSGMDEETKQKIFEPFFTTKEVGRGTGLGLAIVYGIIKQHNGFINVYSEMGKGTISRIYIPAVMKEQEVKDYLVEPEPLQGGTETILVVEDDPIVRKLMESVLGEFGYEVILAVDGQDAVDTFNAHRGKIQLILMDVIMPRKSGKDAADEIRHVDPGAKILFCSGYTAGFIQGRAEFDEGVDLIMKPIQPAQLLKKIRATLDNNKQ